MHPTTASPRDSTRRPRRILVLGASGKVGQEVVGRAIARGLEVTGQTRRAERLENLGRAMRVVEADPRDGAALDALVEGQDAVVSVLGIRTTRETDLFSASTRHVLAAMERHGVRRLVAVTGVGAGETRGHGGFFYDRIAFPLVTKRIYRDKERQEALVQASDVDWTLVRPAVFSERPPSGKLQVLTRVGPGDVLRRVHPREVADFVLDCVERGLHVGEKPFIGHP